MCKKRVKDLFDGGDMRRGRNISPQGDEESGRIWEINQQSGRKRLVNTAKT